MKNHAQGAEMRAAGCDSDALREFISMAVHDLREPLRAIRLGSQLLTNQDADNPHESRERGSRYVQDGVARMETLIRDIAEYCYGEVREMESRNSDLEMSLREAKAELDQELKSSGALVTHDPLPIVPGNANSMVALMRCLIGNACKFHGEASPRIHVEAQRRNDEWTISVSDNGIGFDPTYKERIFRPFERLNGRQFPGSGLGLTIAKRIVEQNGGRIWAESIPDKGSVFYFSLPVTG